MADEDDFDVKEGSCPPTPTPSFDGSTTAKAQTSKGGFSSVASDVGKTEIAESCALTLNAMKNASRGDGAACDTTGTTGAPTTRGTRS